MQQRREAEAVFPPEYGAFWSINARTDLDRRLAVCRSVEWEVAIDRESRGQQYIWSISIPCVTWVTYVTQSICYVALLIGPLQPSPSPISCQSLGSQSMVDWCGVTCCWGALNSWARHRALIWVVVACVGRVRVDDDGQALQERSAAMHEAWTGKPRWLSPRRRPATESA